MALTEKDKKVLQIVGVIIPVVILFSIFLPRFQIGSTPKPAVTIAQTVQDTALETTDEAQTAEAGDESGTPVKKPGAKKPAPVQKPPLKIMGLKELYGEYKKVTEQAAKIQQEVEDKERQVKKKADILAEVGDLERKIELWESRLPDSPRLDGLMAELNTLAQVAGQKYVSMKMQPFREKSSHVELPLEIKLVTDYHALGNFINMTEYSERFSKVDDLSIQGDPEFPGRINVGLVFSTFSFVAESENKDEEGEQTPAASGAGKS